MTIIDQILDCIIRGTIGGICLGICIFGLIYIWKRFFSMSKRILHSLFPKCKWFMPKPKTEDQK